MQRTTNAFATSIVVFLPLAVALDAGSSDVPRAPVVAAVGAVSLLALVGGVLWLPKLPRDTDDPDDPGAFLEALRLRHMARLGWALVPVLAALAGVALLREAWVYAIGAFASLPGFVGAWRTRAELTPRERSLVHDVVMGSP